jgi:glycosyltransferase involved in cell wall biosynthesis
MHGRQGNANQFRPRVAHVVTSDVSTGLMRGQLRFLEEQGFEVTLISSPGEWLDEAGRTENVKTIELPMAREIAPVKDLVALWRLWRAMRALRPTIVNVGTPKAGLLGGCAAWLAGVPCRLYTLHGLRCETSSGLRRRLLVFAEHLACRFAHRIICVSRSLRDKAIALGFASEERIVVFRMGSCNGVDASRFVCTPERVKEAAKLRLKLGIPPQAPVLGFVGRLTRDKGICELVEAFLQLVNRFRDLRLLLVGPFEEGDKLSEKTRKHLETHPQIILAGVAPDTAPYYCLMNILALPSHREGFGTVVLEAYAAGTPVVAARATGLMDAVVDGETGLLFPIGDVNALARCVEMLLEDEVMAANFAFAGQDLVKSQFRPEFIWNALNEEYRRLLGTRRSSWSTPSSGKRAPGSQATNE